MAWLTGWGFRKEVPLPTPGSNLTDVPCRVSLSADADFHEARADGYDVRFTTDDGETLLKYEREYWTGGNGSAATAEFWVKAPSVLSAGGNKLYIYYGKADAADGEDAANVWRAEYKGVWHMSAAAGNEADSSGNSNTLTETGGTIASAAGKIYNCRDFELDDTEWFTITHVAQTGLGITGDISFSTWVNLESRSAHQVMVGKQVDLGEYCYEWKIKNDDVVELTYSADGTNTTKLESTTTFGDGDLGNWVHVAIAADVSAKSATIWWNGASEAANSSGTQVAIKAGTSDVFVGARDPNTRLLDGKLDEVRVYSGLYPTGWVAFEYANMNVPPTLGAEEATGPTYTITIDAGSYSLGGQVMSPLSNRIIPISAGAYSLSGQALSPLYNRIFSMDAGGYSLSGQTISTSYTRLVSAEAGSYSLSGQVLSPLYSRIFSIDAGSYALSGQSLSPLHNRVVSIDAGSYALSGQDVTTLYNRLLSMGTGSYSLGGQVVSLLKDSIISIGAGSYSLSGQSVAALYNRVLSMGAGNYVLTGQDVVIGKLLILLLYSKLLDSISKKSVVPDSITLTSAVLNSITLTSVVSDSVARTSAIKRSIALTSTRGD